MNLCEENPEAFLIRDVAWQLFGTLTFKSERIPEGVRQKMWFAWLRCTGKRLKVKFPRLLWVLRREHGEHFGRLHFHFVLAGLPEASLCASLNFELMDLWNVQLKGGWARVVRYDDDRRGIEYLTKRQGTGYATQSEQIYEMRKFGSRRCDLTLSNSLWRALKRAKLPERKYVRRQFIR